MRGGGRGDEPGRGASTGVARRVEFEGQRDASGARPQKELRQPARLAPQEEDRMAGDERGGGARVETLGGLAGPLRFVLDRCRELGTRRLEGRAVPLDEDVRSAAEVQELRGP